MVWQHKPSGYSLTGTIPCTLSDNISHCVRSTTPLFTPTEQSYPAFLFQIPPFSPWEEISFPFHSCELSDDVMLTEFPLLQTILLTSAPLLATTHSCFKKKGPLTSPHLRSAGWKRHSQITPTSHRLPSYLPAHGCDSGKDGVGFAIFADKSGDVLEIKPLCAEAGPLCLTWTS